MLGQEVHHWRLIINRMGKLGHGEFKIWNDLLSKRSLRAYNSSLKNNQSNVDGLPTSASTAFLNNCQACSNSYGWHETPALLSACLVSIEAEPHLRVFGSPSTSFNSLDNQSTGNGGSSNINSTSSNVISSSSNLGSSMNTKSGSSKGTSRHSLLQAQQWAAVQQQLQSSPDDRSLTHIIVFPVCFLIKNFKRIFMYFRQYLMFPVNNKKICMVELMMMFLPIFWEIVSVETEHLMEWNWLKI